MKNCTELEEFLSAYADSELGESDKRQVENHLAECESCSAFLEMYREISMSLSESSAPVPDALRIGVMNRVLHEDSPRVADAEAKRRRYHVFFTRYAPIAACLAVVLLVWQSRGNINLWNAENAASAPVAAMPDMLSVEMGMDAGAQDDDHDSGGYAIGDDMAVPEAQAADVPVPRGALPSEPEDNMLRGDPRSEQETERIMSYISSAYAEISITGELPAALVGYEPEPFGSWFGWEMVFEIPVDEMQGLLSELSGREEVVVTYYDSNSTYAVVMYSR
jgi:hypothetical protein